MSHAKCSMIIIQSSDLAVMLRALLKLTPKFSVISYGGDQRTTYRCETALPSWGIFRNVAYSFATAFSFAADDRSIMLSAATAAALT